MVWGKLFYNEKKFEKNKKATHTSGSIDNITLLGMQI